MERRSAHIEELKRGRRVALGATFILLLLAITKYIIGYFFNSKILVVDSFHSGVDVLAIFASWFGLWLASRKESKRFPYGLYRAETFVTLLIGILITWAGIENLIEGYRKLFFPVPLQTFPALPVIVSGISVIVSYFVARMEKTTGTFIPDFNPLPPNTPPNPMKTLTLPQKTAM